MSRARDPRPGRTARLGAMVGALAHELKNPLSTLRLNLQLLLEEFARPQSPREERVRRKLEVLRAETARLEAILEDFLRYLRPRRLRRTLVSLPKLLDEVLDFMAPRFEARGIRVHRFYRDVVELYSLDRTYFQVALVNLLVNAEQALAAGGGEVIVRTERRPEAVVLHVIDTGPGIPPELTEKIFDVYFSTKSEGSGMGLAHARRVVEDHGGRLEVHSEVGKGSDFQIWLPLPSPGAGSEAS